MAEPFRVTVLRGETVESVHRVHAVAVRDGQVVESAGDPGFVTFMRSAAKPIQAQPLARARGTSMTAISRSPPPHTWPTMRNSPPLKLSSRRRPRPRTTSSAAPFQGSKLKHNCSGKHAGMLALCHAKGWPYEGYRLANHPCQQAMLAEVAELAGTTEIATAVDGCGVVTFALPLERMAVAFAAVDERVSAAMRAYPELIRGPGALDTSLMQELPGWTAKGGAEGLLCAAGPDGLGLALKAEDGSQRALGPALGAFLDRLGLDGSGFAAAPIYNSRQEVVGSVTSC